MGRASKVVFAGALCVTLMGALSCGGQRAQRAEPAEGASAKDAQGRPLVEMDGGSLRALSAEEEARFVEAAASVTCAVLEASKEMAPVTVDTLSPELVEVAARALERHQLGARQYQRIQQAYQDYPPVRERITAEASRLCGALMVPGQGASSKRPAALDGMSRALAVAMVAEREGRQEAQVPPAASAYVSAAQEIGCRALAGPLSAQERQAILSTHGLNEAEYRDSGRRWRGEPVVGAAIVQGLSRCRADP